MLFSCIHPAFIFDSAGAGEWVVLFIVILIVVGPKRLPEVARKLGRIMDMFRRAADEFKSQIMTMDQPPPPPYTPPPSEQDLSTDGSADPYATGETPSSEDQLTGGAAGDVDGVTPPSPPSGGTPPEAGTSTGGEGTADTQPQPSGDSAPAPNASSASPSSQSKNDEGEGGKE